MLKKLVILRSLFHLLEYISLKVTTQVAQATGRNLGSTVFCFAWSVFVVLGVSLQLLETASERHRAIVEVHHAVAETAFVQQLKLQANVVGERRFAASHHDWCEEQVALVDQSGLESPGRQGQDRPP